MSEDVLTSGEVAEKFGVDPKTVARWAKAGKLTPAFLTLGGHRRYRESDILALLTRGQERFQVHYWAPGRAGVPAVHSNHADRRAADEALTEAIAAGLDRPWLTRYIADTDRWERVTD